MLNINNYKVMTDTFNRCKSEERLIKNIKDSISKQKVIYEDDQLDVKTNGTLTDVRVTAHRTFEEASYFNGNKVAVLNFANSDHPGGGPFFASAQEEALCRTSTLYPCLLNEMDTFYSYHRMLYKTGKIDEYGNSDIIYTPNVLVFKTDDLKPQLLPEGDCYTVDVITCAAPNVINYDYDKLEEVQTKRIKRILDVSVMMGVDVLILGAFGCGAFHNPPELVANIFKKLIYNYDFKTVVFAVYPGKNIENYNIFKKVLEN